MLTFPICIFLAVLFNLNRLRNDSELIILGTSGKSEKNKLNIDTVSLHVHEKIDPQTLIEKLNNKNVLDTKKHQFSFFENPDF